MEAKYFYMVVDKLLKTVSFIETDGNACIAMVRNDLKSKHNLTYADTDTRFGIFSNDNKNYCTVKKYMKWKVV